MQHVKDAKTLPEYEIEDENDQTDIITTKISKNKTFKINDESSLSTPIVSEENSWSSDSNRQNIARVVRSNRDNSENDISESAYPIKIYT